LPPTRQLNSTIFPLTTAADFGSTVNVGGSPKPEVQWFLNGQLLRSGGKISIV
ncbi:unnamed protein product, partial [Rotaria socialis]